MERFTRLGEESIYIAHKIVSDNSQQRMEAEHLLLALLRLDKGIVPTMLDRSESRIQQLETDLLTYIKRYERNTSGNNEVYLSHSCEQIIKKAEQEADQLRDEYLNPEHLLLGVVAHTGTQAATLLRGVKINARKIQESIGTARNGQRITSREAEEEKKVEMVSEYCINLVDLAQENKFDPVIGRDEEVRRVVQVLR